MPPYCAVPLCACPRHTPDPSERRLTRPDHLELSGPGRLDWSSRGRAGRILAIVVRADLSAFSRCWTHLHTARNHQRKLFSAGHLTYTVSATATPPASIAARPQLRTLPNAQESHVLEATAGSATNSTRSAHVRRRLCVFVVWAPANRCPSYHFALDALQHRGQEAGGHGRSERHRLGVYTERAGVPGFDEPTLASLRGHLAWVTPALHDRLLTFLTLSPPCSPRLRVRRSRSPTNGNLVTRRSGPPGGGQCAREVGATSDTALLTALLAALPTARSKCARQWRCCLRVAGAFSFVSWTMTVVRGTRRPRVRPLCGQLERGGWWHETAALGIVARA